MESMTVRPDEASIAGVQAFVEDIMAAAGVGMKQLSRVNIAVDELYTNIVRYSGAHTARIGCAVTPDAVTVELCDDGVAYDPLQAAEPDVTLPAEERGIGGLGIFMTRKLMSSVDYARDDGWNRVTIRLDL